MALSTILRRRPLHGHSGVATGTLSAHQLSHHMASIATLALMFAALFLSANGFLRPSTSTMLRMSSISTRQYATSSIKQGVTTPRSSAAELSKLAQDLSVSPEKVRELLIGQRRKLNGTEAKAKHIDWLLDGTANHSTEVFIRNQHGKNKSVPSKQVNDEQRMQNQVRYSSTTSRIRTSSQNKDATLLTNVEFAQRSDLHPATKRALSETLGLTSMTEIQSKTYAAALSGKDVLGRARTGTGKTIAFLLPAIERILRSPGYDQATDIGILVISPTRELAMQIGNEAEAANISQRHVGTGCVWWYEGGQGCFETQETTTNCPSGNSWSAQGSITNCNCWWDETVENHVESISSGP